MGNYSFKTTGLPEPVNGVVEGHNFTQANPHTAIYAGQSGLTFKNCNLTNCDLPAGSVAEHCLQIHKSFCSHINPSILRKGYITECSVNCSHLLITDTIIIDGVAVDNNYTYQDQVIS